jgi:trehalose/maltose hydrolase-like predicted phosphorylase
VTTDLKWAETASRATSGGASRLVHHGTIAAPNDDGTSPTVAIVVDAVPSSVSLSRAGRTSARFVAVVVASVGMAPSFNVTAAAVSEHTAMQPVATATLVREHVAAWTELTSSRIEVGGRASSERAWQIQTHFASSYYYLLSTVRADWSLGGFSPGGLASQNYEGAVFMDQEFYMAGGLVLMQPQLAMSAARYRIESAPAAAKIAKVFGYDGLMFAWTSAANGAPFGCCDGKGGFENCIEQHITPDVVFFFQQV